MGYDMYQNSPDPKFKERYDAERNLISETWDALMNDIKEKGYLLHTPLSWIPPHGVENPLPFTLYRKADGEDKREIVPIPDEPELYARIDKARKVTPKVHEHYAKDYSYFRLNIWGMGKYLDAMEMLGLVTEAVDVEFPHLPESDDHFNDDGEPLTDEAREYEEKWAEIKKFKHPTSDLPPVNKWMDNSGWHVTASQCQALADRWEKIKDTYDREILENIGIEEDYWLEWMDFHARSAHTDGYLVW